MHFQYLRESEWNPSFEWVKTSLECADKINSYHEDYPKYVDITQTVLKKVVVEERIKKSQLLIIHNTIFSDKPFAGKWRSIDVRVGLHYPPSKQKILDLMSELAGLYIIKDINDLIEWYKDFETIHPFQDGNGRVGGVFVAAYAHSFLPDSGWLAPNQ